MLIITLIIALILAWPTFGLSIIAWLGFAFVSAKRNGTALSHVDDKATYLRTRWFGRNNQVLFIRALAASDKNTHIADLDQHEMSYLANMLVRYIANHQDVFEEFEFLLSSYERQGVLGQRNVIGEATQAIVYEQGEYIAGGRLHLLAYRSMETLRANNPYHAVLSKLRDLDHSADIIELGLEDERDWEMFASWKPE